jgi:hypothetical protein
MWIPAYSFYILMTGTSARVSSSLSGFLQIITIPNPLLSSNASATKFPSLRDKLSSSREETYQIDGPRYQISGGQQFTHRVDFAPIGRKNHRGETGIEENERK